MLKSAIGEHTVSEVDDEKPDHSDGTPSGGFVGWPLIFVFGKYDSDDEMAQSHSDCSDEEDWFSSELVDIPEKVYEYKSGMPGV